MKGRLQENNRKQESCLATTELLPPWIHLHMAHFRKSSEFPGSTNGLNFGTILTLDIFRFQGFQNAQLKALLDATLSFQEIRKSKPGELPGLDQNDMTGLKNQTSTWRTWYGSYYKALVVWNLTLWRSQSWAVPAQHPRCLAFAITGRTNGQQFWESEVKKTSWISKIFLDILI